MMAAMRYFKMKKRIWLSLIFMLGYLVLTSTAEPDGPVYIPNSPQSAALQADRNINSILPTVTVRGFLNFRTTVDGTVIVFTPASETPEDPTPASSTAPSPSSRITPRSDDVPHYPYAKDRNDIKTTELENEAHTDDDRDSVKQLKPGINDLTTPQESNNGGAVSKSSQAQQQQYPTGLVTVLGGTRVNDGATTVFETKVIGTYIDGKYAQILQSTSQIIFSASKSAKPEDFMTPKPSPSRGNQDMLLSSTLSNSITPSKKDHPGSSSYPPTTSTTENEYLPTPAERQAERRLDDPLNVNSVLQTSFKLPESSQNKVIRPTQSLEKSQTRSSYTLSRRFRPSVATPALPSLEDENTVPEFQNTRRPGLRHRYVLPRRNTPSVRLNRFKVKLTVRNDGPRATDRLDNPQENAFDPDDDSIEDFSPLQSLDPAKVTYEKTTITSEVTLHVGRRKSVRTLTITTSVPRPRHDYETDALNDDIHHANNNAIFATSLLEGESYHPNVLTRTYTTTERMLKTSVVPILDGNSTSYHTVTESFFILKLITGYKTLPPGDVTLLTSETEDAEIEATEGPDSALDSLLDGAVTLEPAPHQQIIQTAVPNGLLQTSGSGREVAVVPLESSRDQDADYANNPLLSLGAALQQNPLAAVYLGLQQLNRRATLYSTITKSSTYVATDTIYSTKVLSIYDGRRTRTRTLSESVTTTERTVTTYTTTVTPYLNTQLFPQNQLQQLLATQLPGGMIPPLPPPPPQYSTVTSTITTVTTATSLSTRVYTLIYNAISTKFRTVTSTSLYETTITTTTTSEVPITITAPPGGVFPFLG